jgi:hypothetical protein
MIATSESTAALDAALAKAQGDGDHFAEHAAIRAMFKRQVRPGRQHEKRPLHERLLERVVFGATDCWHWCGSWNDFGYGRMSYEGKLQWAHRLSWRAFVGEIPAGLLVLHRCDNPGCINPDHLWLGTYGDNLRDAWAKGRHKGRTGECRLLPEQQAEVAARNKAGERQVDLAAEFCCSQSLISSVAMKFK